MANEPTDFNSIKVRLEPGGSGSGTLPDTEFQFHKGAIRTEKSKLASARKNYFNSIKVRLELNRRESSAPKPLFQFHKGAIRTIGETPPASPP